MQAASVESCLLAALQTCQSISKSSWQDDGYHSLGKCVYEKGGRYKIVPTQRQGRKLIDINAGHTYTVRRVYHNTTVWRCSIRNHSTYCRATVLQTGKKFRKGFHDHIHGGQLEIAEFSDSGKPRRKRKHMKTAAKNVSDEMEVDTSVIANSLDPLREGNTEPEVPEITMESEVRRVQTVAGSLEDFSEQDDADQDQSLVSQQSLRQQADVSIGSNPVKFIEATIGQMVGPSEGSIGPDVGSEVDITETVFEGTGEPPEHTEEFQENRSEDPECTIIDGSSQRQKAKLIDDAGYMYTLKTANKYTSYWRCAIRNKNTICRASVMQNGDKFRRGRFDHIHPSKPNGAVAARLVAQVKAKAFQEPNESTSNIIGEALLETLGYYQPSPGIPKPSNLARAANRLRQNMHSRHSDNLTGGSVPADFLKRVVKREDKSHILLASPEQLQLLSKATIWYIDINPKVVKAPLKQLVSIHALVAEKQGTKQVPMAFILMSSKKKKDYKAVLQAIKDCVPGECPVNECILDYEAALWRAFSDVFPGIKCFGTAFHWSQSIWRKIQDFGIQQIYMHGYSHSKTYKLLKKLMALSFLPSELIPKMVTKLQEKAHTGMLHQLLNYVEATWIEGPLCKWSPSVWSVYKQPWRISSELETWQQQLNKRIKKDELSLSILIMHLFSESKAISVQVKLASKRKLEQHHKAAGRNQLVVKLWGEFLQGDVKLKQLLKACASLYGPECSTF